MSRLHHVALGARDVAGVAAFYRDVLGLAEVARHDDADGRLRSIWLDLGGAVLMVERTGRVRPRVEGIDAGAFLLAVRAPDGRDAAERRLSAFGRAIEDRSEFTTYARDPEGNRVAVSEYPLPV